MNYNFLQINLQEIAIFVYDLYLTLRFNHLTKLFLLTLIFNEAIVSVLIGHFSNL